MSLYLPDPLKIAEWLAMNFKLPAGIYRDPVTYERLDLKDLYIGMCATISVGQLTTSYNYKKELVLPLPANRTMHVHMRQSHIPIDRTKHADESFPPIKGAIERVIAEICVKANYLDRRGGQMSPSEFYPSAEELLRKIYDRAFEAGYPVKVSV